MKWPRLIRQPADSFGVEIPVIFLDIKVSGGDNGCGGIRSPRFSSFSAFVFLFVVDWWNCGVCRMVTRLDTEVWPKMATGIDPVELFKGK